MVTAGQNEEAIPVSSYAPNALRNFARKQRKINIKERDMINGTCIHCDTEEDLVPVCIDCVSSNKVEQYHFKPKELTGTNEKVTMVVEKGCNSPSKAVSQDSDTQHPDAIKNALNRLKTKFGYGIPDVDCLFPE